VVAFGVSASAVDFFDSQLVSRCFASGNFEAQVDFSLPV